MIKTQGGAHWLDMLSSNYPDTIIRTNETHINALVKPTNNCQVMILAGIYEKKTGVGKVFVVKSNETF